MADRQAFGEDRAMWTPPQWPAAFLGVLAATLAVCAVMAWSHSGHGVLAFGVAGGALAGVYLAMAWTIRRQVWPASAALAAACVPMATLAALLEPKALAPGAAAAAAVVALWLFGYGRIGAALNREVMGPPQSLDGSGAAGRALIVHHPSPGGFQTRVQRAFADGLIGRGWRVDLATASREAPVDLAGIDLLVLGAPAYNFRVGRPLLDYLKRLGSLDGRRVVLVVTGGGMTEAAMDELRRRVEAKGGRVIAAYELWASRPNLERFGTSDPVEIMRRAAADLV